MCSLYCDWHRFAFSCATQSIKHWKRTYVHPVSWNSSNCWLVMFFSPERHTACIWGWEFSFSFFWRSKFITFPYENCSCPFFWGLEVLSVSCFHLKIFHFLRAKVYECFMLPYEKKNHFRFPEGESFWVFHVALDRYSLCWGWEFLSVSDFFPVWNERVEFWNGRLHDNS